MRQHLIGLVLQPSFRFASVYVRVNAADFNLVRFLRSSGKDMIIATASDRKDLLYDAPFTVVNQQPHYRDRGFLVQVVIVESATVFNAF
jgi:hypothetical protein